VCEVPRMLYLTTRRRENLKSIDNPPNAKLEIESRHINTMDSTIIVPPSVRVLIKMGVKSKKSKVETLIGMLKEYKDKYTSVELQKEAMNWKEGT
jgi:hypothetical protein